MSFLDKVIELEIELDNGSTYLIPFTVDDLLYYLLKELTPDEIEELCEYLKDAR